MLPGTGANSASTRAMRHCRPVASTGVRRGPRTNLSPRRFPS